MQRLGRPCWKLTSKKPLANAYSYMEPTSSDTNE